MVRPDTREILGWVMVAAMVAFLIFVMVAMIPSTDRVMY